VLRFAQRTVAGVGSMAVLFAFLLGPMAVYRIATGQPLSGPGADWEHWLLVASGGLGAGVAWLVHYLLLTRLFGFTDREAEAAWRKPKRRR
jgi:hypothetical protein